MKRKGKARKNGMAKLDILTFSMEIRNKSQNFFFCTLPLKWKKETFVREADISEISHVFKKKILYMRTFFSVFHTTSFFWMADWAPFKAFCVRDFRYLHVFYYRFFKSSIQLNLDISRGAAEHGSESHSEFNDIFIVAMLSHVRP